ncbi:MAG: glycerol-3-phosphate 1-O-acyltransferase PlsY [Lachnospirales bacterium]
MVINKLICVLVGYAFGCLQTAYIFGKLLKGIDIREYGSGNAGTTNAIRVLGPKIGAVVFICDALKGVVAYIISYLIFKDFTVALYAGFGAVMGHNFPAQLGFRGGKGVATSLGVLLISDINSGIYILGIAIIIIIFTKYISLASISCASIYLVVAYFKHGFGEVFIIYAILVLLLLYRHRSNIKRLLSGTENKLSFKSKMEKIKK